MEFKRLNNMTGKDQVLNRRITSIFVNELENARNQVLAINQENLPALEFTMHKVRPSLLIFEQEFISKEFEALLDLYKTDPANEGLSDKISSLAGHMEQSVQKLRDFLNTLG